MERDAPTLPEDQPLDGILRRLAAHDPILGRRYAWPVVDAAGKLTGIVTRGDLVRMLERDASGEMTVLEAGTRDPVVTFPDELRKRWSTISAGFRWWTGPIRPGYSDTSVVPASRQDGGR